MFFSFCILLFLSPFFFFVVTTFEETGLCLKFFCDLGFADTAIFEEIRVTQVSEFLKGVVKCM